MSASATQGAHNNMMLNWRHVQQSPNKISTEILLAWCSAIWWQTSRPNGLISGPIYGLHCCSRVLTAQTDRVITTVQKTLNAWTHERNWHVEMSSLHRVTSPRIQITVCHGDRTIRAQHGWLAWYYLIRLHSRGCQTHNSKYGAIVTSLFCIT